MVPDLRIAVTCFAPDITAHLSGYASIISSQPDGAEKEWCTKLLEMVKFFQLTPKSDLAPVSTFRSISPQGKSSAADIIPLKKEEIDRIFEQVPWQEEIDMLKVMFEKIPSGAFRELAHHLLWYAQELCGDREPMTKESLRIL